MNLLCSWSGGKDSCYALMRMHHKPKVLLNALNENGEISRSHGLSKAFLKAQASAIGCDIHFIAASWTDYTNKFINKLTTLQKEYALTDAVFGDIDLDAHRKWEEDVCKKANLKCNLPLWQEERRKLVLEMIDYKIETIIVSCNDELGPEFLGKKIDKKTISLLEAKGVDICGENGEFHTAVVNCPLFNKAIKYKLGEKLNNGNNYHFIEVSVD